MFQFEMPEGLELGYEVFPEMRAQIIADLLEAEHVFFGTGDEEDEAWAMCVGSEACQRLIDIELGGC